ncbi:hypothetical protein, partial [Staphylococcus sp. GDX8P80P]|uniref:hypothetical protein n=1 Tax=Staphylococcus sp. GDX8P80P TaxID=2804104 RepID=UPI001AEC1F08
FGFMKAILGFTRMSVRGLNKVKRELGFVLMALNINPSSLLTLYIHCTDIQVKPKVAFINSKTDLTSIFLWL